MSIFTFSLQSGSNGNSIYVETDDVRLLFDAGISGKQAELRMAAHGRDIRDVDALIISHDHVDHARCAGIYQRKFGLPIYMTRPTHRAIWCGLGPLSNVCYFRSGRTLEFDGLRVHTVRTSHDAVDGVAFIIESSSQRLGIFTDLGHPFRELQALLESVDGAYLESNYDPQMLEQGPYSRALKRRIRGPAGHLSNVEAAELLARCSRKRPKWVALAHLSEVNNHPELALDTHRARVGQSYPFEIAGRHGVSPILVI